MKNQKAIVLTVLSLFVSLIASQAQVPELINYQGRMVDGGTLVNGTTQIIFRIYDDPSVGTLQYAETQTVTVVDGFVCDQHRLV